MVSFKHMEEVDIWRHCIFYYNYMNKFNIALRRPKSFKDSLSCANLINGVILKAIPDKKERERFIEGMEFSCSNSLLRLDYFDWLKTSERACYWLWGQISFNESYKKVAGPFIESVYNESGSKTTPYNTEYRYRLILLFCDIPSSPLDVKKNYLNVMREWWEEIYSSPAIFKWLDKDDESQCQWVWEYIKKSQAPYAVESLDSDEDNNESNESKEGGKKLSPSLYLNPLSHHERYLAIYASYDLWNAHEDTKKLFLKNINKAWSQKKLRDNREGKKSLNTYLRSEVKDQLDELSRCYEKSKQAVLEMLIENEYKNKRKID
jgi:hypothetical protein